MTEIKQAFIVDGKTFDTKADAIRFIREPKVKAAIAALVPDNTELQVWLFENQEVVENAFETGTSRRVTKAEAKSLATALDAVEATADSRFEFLAEHKAAIISCFKWPTVKKMSDAEKALQCRNTIQSAEGGSEELANWAIANRDAILEAYVAGIEKRKVSDKASKGLLTYRTAKALEKAIKGALEGKEITAESVDGQVVTATAAVKTHILDTDQEMPDDEVFSNATEKMKEMFFPIPEAEAA